jgi:hypothetical protein
MYVHAWTGHKHKDTTRANTNTVCTYTLIKYSIRTSTVSIKKKENVKSTPCVAPERFSDFLQLVDFHGYIVFSLIESHQ